VCTHLDHLLTAPSWPLTACVVVSVVELRADNAVTGVTQSQKPQQLDSMTLTPASTWRVRLDLTAPGSATPVSITASVRFEEEDGFEPPQGFMIVDSCKPEGALALGRQGTRWVLSEDPEDRKDSLWICTTVGENQWDPT